MEDTLREERRYSYTGAAEKVLILVLMEDTLRGKQQNHRTRSLRGLNPCFNGRYSQSMTTIREQLSKAVLILVLMEDTLRATG